eukprot:Tamp_21217.p1 GENE.Tamp_21217~~Tamp_21217.p1  ORF type:complete len:351 (+),score=71.22 Tamp_21217:36-1088(+)
MFVVVLEDEKLTVQVGTLADGGYRSVLAPLIGGSVFLSGVAARQGKKESASTDAAIMGVAAVAGAAIAHYGSMTTQWTFDKNADYVYKTKAPFWQAFGSAKATAVCTCSELSPKDTEDGAKLSLKSQSGVLFETYTSHVSFGTEVESLRKDKEMMTSDAVTTRYTPKKALWGQLHLICKGKAVPIASSVRAGQAYMVADFLAFDWKKVSATALSNEEKKLAQALFDKVDDNGDGVLQPKELRTIEAVMPKELAVLGAASPLLHLDHGTWVETSGSNIHNKTKTATWTTREKVSGTLADHFDSLDVNHDGVLQFEEFERWVKLRKTYPPKGSPPGALEQRLSAWLASVAGR